MKYWNSAPICRRRASPPLKLNADEAMKEDDAILDNLQRAAFNYFLLLGNKDNGLIPDTSRQGVPCSIAAVGFALSAYPVAAERGWITRAEAARRTLTTLRFFWNGPPDGSFADIGHKGFCYHFLDMHTGRRAWDSEVSFIDTGLLTAGILLAATYFDGETPQEREIRELADKFYRRIEWNWALNNCQTLALAWRPESGFSPYRWRGYSEGLILYFLGLGSPTFPLESRDYDAWLCSYQWRTYYGIDYLYGCSLFIHHFSHAWVDFRGIQDAFMRRHDCDYFENSRRAALAQRCYAAENKKGFAGYGPDCWGFSACDGPNRMKIKANDKTYEGRGYAARGAPEGLDDGTLSLPSVVASLPFVPSESMSAFLHIRKEYPDVVKNDNIGSAFNPTISTKESGLWISDGYYGLEQGIMLMMIENYRTQFIWQLMKKNAYLRRGLEKADFKGGWLE
jgi:hypothetical protein